MTDPRPASLPEQPLDPERGSARTPVQLEIETSELYGAALNTDLTRLLTGAQGNPIQLWDTLSGQCLQEFRGQAGTVYGLAWSPDQRQFLSGSSDRTMRLWDVRSGRELRTYEAHQDYVQGLSPASDWPKLVRHTS